ncbi:MAG: sodium-independent anion transporter, partial [Pusillimonas sp.]|nr:sodium-independent anion transporter [Pusillimonas sp.]
MQLLPEWLVHYRKAQLPGDLTAGVIVTVMLIPQSLAYAMLAGLPPEIGLYASVLPLVVYALIGSSMTLAVGPVAVASLMTASALQPLAQPGTEQYMVLAAMLALLSGVMLLAFGLLRLGFLANFLSHPVISGFISGSAILITVSQLKHLFGLTTDATNVFQEIYQLIVQLPQSNQATTVLGMATLFFLLFSRCYLAGMLQKSGLAHKAASLLSRLAPMAAVIISIVAVARWNL